MSGTKTLVNNTGAALSVTLVVRAGDDPSNVAGYQPVSLTGGQQQVSYGGPSDPYLNGLVIGGVVGGTQILQQAMVEERGTAFDDVLNTNDTLHLSLNGGVIDITGSNG